MTTPSNDEFEYCPRCGTPYDTRSEAVIICRGCGGESSTGCCHPHGAGNLCERCDMLMLNAGSTLIPGLPAALAERA